MHKFSIVLFEPEIPGNTGTIGRTCLALNIRLILIKPYGFDISEKSVKRAGLDYWKHVDLTEYNSWQDFLIIENPQTSKLFFLSKKSNSNYYDANFCQNSFLIFGSETKGLPSEMFQKYSKNFYKLPMFNDYVRSLNLSNSATAVAYECLRQISF